MRWVSAGDKVMGLFGTAPRYHEFYVLFERAGHNVEKATGLLAELMETWPDEGNRLRHEIKLLEEEGDTITHGVIQHLNLRAAVPFASSDAHRLVSDLDDVVDFAEEVADFMGLYRVEAPTDQAIQLASTLRACGVEISAALSLLADLPRTRPHIVALDRLEHEGDHLERRALTSLFDGGIDPMVVIRWKDIYERLEEGIDASAHVGRTLGGILTRRP